MMTYIRQWVECGGIFYPEFGEDEPDYDYECEQPEEPEKPDYWFNFDCIPEEYQECWYSWQFTE